MRKILSLIIIGVLGLSMFSIFTQWTAKAQEIVWNTNLTPLPTPTTVHVSIVHNGRIYVIGGRIDGVPYVGVPNVYFADINSDGTVGSWTETTPLPEHRHGGTAVIWNDFVYVIAGAGPTYGGRSEQSTVFYAEISSDGRIEEWNETTLLPERLVNHAAVVWNGRIYVAGGWNGYSPQDEIYYAEINSADGSLSNWIENPIPLPFRWESTCALVYDGTICLIGGWYGPKGPPHDKVYCASIETDGTIGPWDEYASLPKATATTRCALIDNDIYVVGGRSGPDGEVAEKTVYTAKFYIGDWTEVQSIPAARIGHSVVTYDDRIYVTGGYDSWWDYEDTIYYSSSLLRARATVDIAPNTLNLKSKGKWITAYIELPEEYDVNDINVSTILLNDTVPAEMHPTDIGDKDGDGVPDLMVKFDRASVIDYIENNMDWANPERTKPLTYMIILTVTGTLYDDTQFEGGDTIRVLKFLKGQPTPE